MVEKIEAYWFTASDRLSHGDNRKIVLGETHSLDGEIIICKRALHASRDPFDALEYAPGPYLYRVLCWGDVVEQHDKLGAHHREYIAMRDSTNILRRFARAAALSVIHLWTPPDIVRRYLETGDETIRGAARSAARFASWRLDASSVPAWVAARATSSDPVKAAVGTAWAVWDVKNVAAAAKKQFSELVAELFDGSTGQ